MKDKEQAIEAAAGALTLFGVPREIGRKVVRANIERDEDIQAKALSHAILSAKVVQDAYSAAKDMNREKLIEVVRWIALSHERMRAELAGAENLIREREQYDLETRGDA